MGWFAYCVATTYTKQYSNPFLCCLFCGSFAVKRELCVVHSQNVHLFLKVILNVALSQSNVSNVQNQKSQTMSRTVARTREAGNVEER